MKPRDGHLRHGPYSVGFDIDKDGNTTFAVFDPRTQSLVAMITPDNPLDRTRDCVGGLRCVMHEGQCDTCPNRPEVTEDIEAEVIEPKRLKE